MTHGQRPPGEAVQGRGRPEHKAVAGAPLGGKFPVVTHTKMKQIKRKASEATAYLIYRPDFANPRNVILKTAGRDTFAGARRRWRRRDAVWGAGPSGRGLVLISGGAGGGLSEGLTS